MTTLRQVGYFLTAAVTAAVASTFAPYPGTSVKVADCKDSCPVTEPECCTYSGVKPAPT